MIKSLAQSIKIMRPTQHIMQALFHTLPNIILSLRNTFSHKDKNSKQSIQPHINLLSKTSHTVRTFLNRTQLRDGADKSFARPGRKQATATKLGIYSTHSPRSSIHFLARCFNFCKPLKKIQKVVRLTRSPRQQWPPRRTKNSVHSIAFFQSREQVVVPRGQIRRRGWVIKTWKPR